MSFTIKQREEKYRLQLDGELWEIPTRAELDSVMETILNYKAKYGRFKKKGIVEHERR